jgi:fumarate hydratase class II
MANDAAVGFVGAGGYLEMNMCKSLIFFKFTHSITLLTDGCTNFRKLLGEGTKPDLKRIKEFVDRTLKLGLVTGDEFDRVVDSAKVAHPYVAKDNWKHQGSDRASRELTSLKTEGKV